jgi:hypothetical protein
VIHLKNLGWGEKGFGSRKGLVHGRRRRPDIKAAVQELKELAGK